MLRKVILCPNPYRDAQLRVAKEAKRVLDEVGCPNVVCLPFRNQEPPEGYGLNIEPLQQEIRGADMIIAFGGRYDPAPFQNRRAPRHSGAGRQPRQPRLHGRA